MPSIPPHRRRQVVKSAGPVYACVLSTLVLRQRISRNVWLSLLPIIGGVGLATLKELSFAWAALIGAVVSDLTLALRNVYSKLSMDGKGSAKQPKLSPANTFGLVTCLSVAPATALALAVEGPTALSVWRAAVPTRSAATALLAQIVLTGLYFYGYSEVAMKALSNVHPVTHAIGNTLRRVVIMVVCIFFFRTPISTLGAVGSGIAIAGSYIYAMVKTFEKQQAEKDALAAATAVQAGGGASAPAASESGGAAEPPAKSAVEQPLLPVMKLAGWGALQLRRLQLIRYRRMRSADAGDAGGDDE